VKPAKGKRIHGKRIEPVLGKHIERGAPERRVAHQLLGRLRAQPQAHSEPLLIRDVLRDELRLSLDGGELIRP
jgi:hypothetical protein